MEQEKVARYKAGAEAMRSAAEECTTTAIYLDRLVAMNEDSKEVAGIAEPQVIEIIRDEANHALRYIFNVFVPATGIEPDTDGLEDI